MAVFQYFAPRGGQWVIVALAGLILVGGCGPGGYSGPTGTVRGTVKLKGEPVPAGTGVTFLSDEGFAASGRVSAGGAYELSIAGKGNQIPAARYQVMLSAPATGGAAEGDADYEAMMTASASGGGGQMEAPAAESIPSKYQSAATSGLSYEVQAGDNTINIELE